MISKPRTVVALMSLCTVLAVFVVTKQNVLALSCTQECDSEVSSCNDLCASIHSTPNTFSSGDQSRCYAECTNAYQLCWGHSEYCSYACDWSTYCVGQEASPDPFCVGGDCDGVTHISYCTLNFGC